MPDCLVHYSFGCDVLNQIKDIKGVCIDVPTYIYALNGPDEWEWYRFWVPFLRAGKHKRISIMHNSKTGEFLKMLLMQVEAASNPDALFSYYAGFVCHYCLDQLAHPFIIYRGGFYDGTVNTKKYRGNHMALEHEIDNLELEHLKEKDPLCENKDAYWKVLKAGRLSRDCYEDLNIVYKKVYGWENCVRDMKKARRDQVRFTRIMSDRFGIVYRLTVLLLKDKPQFTALSYYKTRYSNRDVLNLRHDKWKNPYDKTMCENYSFIELRLQAEKIASKIIETSIGYLNGQVTFKEIDEIIGNRSYSSGLDTDDERNLKMPECI